MEISRDRVNHTISLSQQPYIVNPSKAHLRGVDHLARYVKGSRDMLLTFGGSDESEVLLFCYTDAAHLQDQSAKPRMGYTFFLNLAQYTLNQLKATLCRTLRANLKQRR